MIIHYGVYFHSPDGFRYFYSNDALITLNVGLQLGPLIKPEVNAIDVGSKYFFYFPLTHEAQNWMVFGIGETVYTLEPVRKGLVRVPYIQFFLSPLSDFVASGLIINPKKLEQHCRPYQEVFNEYATSRKVKCQVLDESIGDTISNNQVKLSLFEIEKREKTGVENFEQAIELHFSKIQKQPRIIGWAYATIIAPVDGTYPTNFVTVYHQKIIGQAAETEIENICMDDKGCFEEFEKFTNDKLLKNLQKVFDSEKIERIISIYNSFVQKKKEEAIGGNRSDVILSGANVQVQIPKASVEPKKTEASGDGKVDCRSTKVDANQIESKISEELNVVMKSAARISDLHKKILTSDEANKQISNAAVQAYALIRKGQNFREAINSIDLAIDAIYYAVKDTEGNSDQATLCDSTRKAFNTLADCCYYISEQIYPKRAAFTCTDEETLVALMKKNNRILFVVNKLKEKNLKPLNHFTFALKEIFIAMEKVQLDESKLGIQNRFKDYFDQYFSYKMNYHPQ